MRGTLSIVDAARDAPHAAALVTRDETLDFASLARRVAGAARFFLSAGLDPDAASSLVALTPTLSVDSIVAVLACIELGVPFVALHPRSPVAERARLLERVAPTLVVSREVCFEPSDESLPRRAIDAERALAVLFTSGTSGTPKPVVLSRRAFVASAEASSTVIPLGPSDRWLLALPPAHVGGLSVITRSLLARSGIVLGGDGPFDPAATLATIDGGATITSLVPTTLRRLLDHDRAYRPPSSLRCVLLGGAAAPPSLLDEARDRGFPIRGTYGLTEACSQVATWASERDEGAGRPLAGFDVRILGDDGRSCGASEEGEIAVRSRSLFSGTWPLDGSRAHLDPEGFFHTGDLGHLDERGFLHVHARRSDLIVSGGENVYPAEVEAALLACAGVEGACVVGLPDEDLGQRVGAAVVLRAGTSLSAVSAQLRAELASHKVPRVFAVVPTLPLLATGKVDRRAVGASLEAERT